MDNTNNIKKTKENGISMFKNLFEIKRPLKYGQSATLPRTKNTAIDDNNVSKDKLFVRHQSYRRNSNKYKYKKESTQKIQSEKFTVETESTVKKMCEQFEIIQVSEQENHVQQNDSKISNNCAFEKQFSEESEELIKNFFERREEHMKLLRQLHENTEVKKRIYEKNSKLSREKKIQSFVEAENDEETEEYRKSLITEMDMELAQMKEDGFMDEQENILMEEYQQDNVFESKEYSIQDETFLTHLQRNSIDSDSAVFLEQKSLDRRDSDNQDDVFFVKTDSLLAQMKRNTASYKSDNQKNIFKPNQVNDKEEQTTTINEEDQITLKTRETAALNERFRDEFSENFGEDFENGFYILEAYNDDGRELIEVQVMIDRRIVNIDTSKSIQESMKESLMTFYQHEDKTIDVINEKLKFDEYTEDNSEKANAIQLSDKNDVQNICELMKQELTSPISINSGPTYEYIEIPNEDNPLQPFYVFAPLSNRSTMYSTTSQESSTFDDDDEGIEIGRNKEQQRYQNVRRETFCDDKGVVRIERVVCSENIPFISEDVPSPVSRSNSSTTTRRLEFIIEEIKTTEKKYCEDLTKVVKLYKPYIEEHTPPSLKEYTGYLFCNIEKIYRRQREFLKVIEKCEDVDQIIQCFIHNQVLFEMYPKYFKNKPKADTILKDFSVTIKIVEGYKPKEFIKIVRYFSQKIVTYYLSCSFKSIYLDWQMQEKFEERLDFSAYLLTPVQRLGKYILFLENIEKQLTKLSLPVENAQRALEIIRYEMSKGNDGVAIESIENSPISKTDYGSFKMRGKFTINKYRKIEGAVVFLFSNVVVFTTEDSRNLETFTYNDSIKMNDLRIASFDDYTIHLTDYTKSKKKQNTSKYTYILEAKTEKIWRTWRETIEKILWDQLVKVKESFLKLPPQNQKKYKVGRNRVKSTGSSVFYCE